MVDCKECGGDCKGHPEMQRGSELGAAADYGAALVELKRLLVAAKKNRLDEDPEEINEGWAGYIQGIKGAIYRLVMHTST